MSDCSCSIDCDYGDCDVEDFATYHKERVVKAFSPKKCFECGREIKQGEQYLLSVARWRKGGFERYHTCIDCKSVLDHIFCRRPYHGGLWEELHNHLQDCYEEEFPIGCLPYLTPKAREGVCEAIEEQWKEIEELNED